MKITFYTFLGKSLKNLSYIKSNIKKVLEYVDLIKKTHALINTWNFIIFFLLTKWKGKKGLMRGKVKIEKVEMKVIKWELEMTIEKKKMKRERERERFHSNQI